MNKFSKKYLDKYYSQLINKFESQNYSYEISQIAQKLKNCKIKKGKVGIFGNGEVLQYLLILVWILQK